MRTHGWSGSAPATDEEAVARILAAANKAIDARGADLSIADVARTLGVTRQTVYRYFPSTDALLQAAAMASAAGFLDRMAAHLSGITDPAEAVTEGIAAAVEALPHDKHMGLLLGPERVGAFSAEVRVDVTGDLTLRRLRAELSEGCAFTTSAVVAGLGGLQGRKPFDPLETGRVSRWVAQQPVRPARLFLSFAGNPGTCTFALFDESNAPVDDGPRVTTVLAIFSTQGFGGFLQPSRGVFGGLRAKF